MSYCVTRTDLLSGTKQPSDIVSVKYMGSGSEASAIENGNVVKLSGLMTGEREIFKGVTPGKDTGINEIVLIATPEVMYDERKRNLDEFRNEADAVCRGYRLRSGNIFSVTADGIANAKAESAALAVGDVIELQAGVKLQAAAALTSGSTKVGTIIGIEATGRYTYYVIQVA